MAKKKFPKTVIDSNVQAITKNSCGIDKLMDNIEARKFIKDAYDNNENVYITSCYGYHNNPEKILEKLGVKTSYKARFIELSFTDGTDPKEHLFFVLDEAQESLAQIVTLNQSFWMRKLTSIEKAINCVGVEELIKLQNAIADERVFEIHTAHRGNEFAKYLNEHAIKHEQQNLYVDSHNTPRSLFIIQNKQDAENLVNLGLIAAGPNAQENLNEKMKNKRTKKKTCDFKPDETRIYVGGKRTNSSSYWGDALSFRCNLRKIQNGHQDEAKIVNEAIKGILNGDDLKLYNASSKSNVTSIKSEKVVDTYVAAMRKNPNFAYKILDWLIDEENDEYRKTIDKPTKEWQLVRIPSPCGLTDDAFDAENPLNYYTDENGYNYFLFPKYHNLFDKELALWAHNSTCEEIINETGVKEYGANPMYEERPNIIQSIQYEQWPTTIKDLANYTLEEIIKRKPNIKISKCDKFGEGNDHSVPNNVTQVK